MSSVHGITLVETGPGAAIISRRFAEAGRVGPFAPM